MNKLFSFAYWLDSFFKARGHKYIKRVPSGTTKTGRIRYRYIYKVGHTHRGRHVHDHDDMVVNAKFMIHSKSGEEIHIHIKEVKENGDLVVVYDDGPNKGKEKTMSKQGLEGLLDYEHNLPEKLGARQEKLEAQLKRMKEGGKASAKQIARVEKELASYYKKQPRKKETELRPDTPLKETKPPLKKEPIEEEGEAGIMAKVDEALADAFGRERKISYWEARPDSLGFSLEHNGVPITLKLPRYTRRWVLTIGDKKYENIIDISKKGRLGDRSKKRMHDYDGKYINKKVVEDYLLHAIYSIENPEVFEGLVSSSDKKEYTGRADRDYHIFGEEKEAIRDRLKQQKKTKKKKPPTPEVKTEPPTPEVKTDPTPAPPKKEEQESDFSRFETVSGKQELHEGVLSRLLTGKESGEKALSLKQTVKRLLRSQVYADVGKAVAFYDELNARLPKSGKKLKEALIEGIELPNGVTIKADMNDFGRVIISRGAQKNRMSLVSTDFEPKYFSVNDEKKIFLMSDGGGETKKVSRNDLLAHLLAEHRASSISGGGVLGRIPRAGAMFEHKFMRALYDEATSKEKAVETPEVSRAKKRSEEIRAERKAKQAQQDAVVKELSGQVEQDPYKVLQSRANKEEQKRQARESGNPLVDLDVDSMFDESSLRSRLGNVTYNPERMIRMLKSDLRQELVKLNNIGHDLMTDSNQAEVQNAIDRKEKKLKELYMAYVNAKANTSSWAVTGRGGRNERRERKKLDAEKRKLDALLEFSKGMERSLKKELGSLSDTDMKIKEKEAQVTEHMEELILAEERAKVHQDDTLTDDQKVKKLVQLYPFKGDPTVKDRTLEAQARSFLRREASDRYRGPIAEAKQAKQRLNTRKRELFELKGIKKGTFTQYADLFKHLLK